nr:hypothetical protein [Bacteroides faecalis]
MTKTESGELGSAVNAYIERIRADRSIVPRSTPSTSICATITEGSWRNVR